MDFVVYEKTPLADYLESIESNESVISQPDPSIENLSAPHIPLAKRATMMLERVRSGIKSFFSASLPMGEILQFEEEFKYLICSSHLLNDTASVHFYEQKLHRPSTYIPDTCSSTSVSIAGYKFSREDLGLLLLSGGIGVFAWAKVMSTEISTGEQETIESSRADIQHFDPWTWVPTACALGSASCFWLYRWMKRKHRRKSQDKTLRWLRMFVNRSQTLDSKINKSLITIQEIELVSRGYRLSTPLSPVTRIEQSSRGRRCMMLRLAVLEAVYKQFSFLQSSIDALKLATHSRSLYRLYDMYDVNPLPPGILNYRNFKQINELQMDQASTLSAPTDAGASESDVLSLHHLKRVFQLMHGKRRECLCTFLALNAMATPRPQDEVEINRAWRLATWQLKVLAENTHELFNQITEALDARYHSYSSIHSSSAQSDMTVLQTPDKKLQAYFRRLAMIEQHMRGIHAKLYICGDDARKFASSTPFSSSTSSHPSSPTTSTFSADSLDSTSIYDDVLLQDERDRLVDQFVSIGQDLSMLMQEWELGRTALLDFVTAHSDLNPASNGDVDIGDGLMPSPPTSDCDDNSRRQTMLLDCSQPEDPLRYMEDEGEGEKVYEALTDEPCMSRLSDGVKLTREERIAKMKARREAENQQAEMRRETEKMVFELKDVLKRRREDSPVE
ncbi:uncharacterized protein VTP21DRAFT_11155 [Calcarisporiella thermophila]|uniref:uncharacterized protein n=1 Tax=Calcarisporiella thermophila TaxID=911321 RepID=UPI003741F321